MSDGSDFEICSASGGGRAERLDVILTPGGRRRWTPEARARIIAESLEPGANVSEVARRHRIFPQQLYTWRRGLGERAEALSFVPAVVEREDEARVLRPITSPSGQIVIETGALSIRIPADVSADHIERVLLAVQVNA